MVSKRKGDVIYVLPSREIFPAIFSNETVDLSCSISVLENIMQNINRAGQNAVHYFITLKDQKENFLNNPKTRLLYPAKNELGRISKAILDKINLNLRNTTKTNQWKNTNDLISWFKSIKNKQNCTFISFDIKDFYATITKKLLSKCLSFADTKVQITEHDKKIIDHSRK